MGEKCIQSSRRKPEGKRPPGRPRHTCEDNINMDLKEIGWEGGGVDSTHLDHDWGQ
jgi:hypothetical protein